VCGIAALIDPERTLGPEAPRAMIDALRHRGPDGSGSAHVGPATLLHTRLAIIDPRGGEQPLRSEDGRCVAVVNGEIYNHRELRTQLERDGHTFATGSDSEVILHGYEQHGTAFVRRLNGIFAFALWDASRERLVVARDVFGVKPAYWWRDGRRIVVASEVGALLAAGVVRPRLDAVALDHLLAWRFVPAPRTLFSGVSKLPPASLLVAERGSVRVESYRTPPGPVLAGRSARALEEELQDNLVAAVGRQMMSDVPYGAFLSGGVDSAAVVASMRRAGDAAPLTFTIGFPEQASRDERAAARTTAAALGSDHHEATMLERDFGRELANGLAHLEEPCGSQSAPALLALSRFASRSVKVVLSGQGADEPHGGYRRSQAMVALGLIGRLPPVGGRLVRAADAVPRAERVRRAARVLSSPAGLDRLLTIFEITPPELRARLTGRGGEEAADERRRLASDLVADLEGRELLDRALYLDTRLVLPDSLLLYGDKMSMAVGLEHRVPFLDLELMSFVERIPAAQRMRFGVRKSLYRRAMRGLVPDTALRRAKQGFTTPYDQWLRRSLGAEVQRRYAPGSEIASVVDSATVAELVAAHRAGRADLKRILYCLLELAEWQRVFVEGRSPAPAPAGV
jgi:asparagine synthase (glutamine-hydrolysing)